VAITVTAYVTKSGQTAKFFSVNGSTWPMPGITNVVSNPTISVNGNAIALHDGPIVQWGLGFPFISYGLSCGPVQSIVVQKGGNGYSSPTASVNGGGSGSGCVLGTPVVASGVIKSIPIVSPGSGYTAPITITITDTGAGSGAVAVPIMGGVQPGDTVTYSAAAGMIVTGSGNSPLTTNVAMGNYSGQLEPGLAGACDFGLPDNQKTVKVGFVFGESNEVAATSAVMPNINWLKRADRWTNGGGNGVGTARDDGKPLTIVGTATALIDDVTSNPIDSTNYPGMVGTWTLVTDETNPANPMVMGLTCNSNFTVTPLGTGGLVSAGTLTGGVLVGRVFQWTVTRNSSTKYNMTLTLTATAGSGTHPFTLSDNTALFDPITTAAYSPTPGVGPFPSRSNLLGPPQQVINLLTTSKANVSSIRFGACQATGYGTSMVDACDLKNATEWSWNNSDTNNPNKPTGRRTLANPTIRTYATSSSAWPTWTGVCDITITNGGSGYTGATTASASGGSGSGCTLGTPIISGGVITSIPVTAAGTGYQATPPTIVIIDSGGGSGAVATPTIFRGPVTWSASNIYTHTWSVLPDKGVQSITVTNGGSGYSAGVTAFVTGDGNGCVLGTPVLSGGVIQSIPVIAGGSGYTIASVVIAGSGGTLAAATANLVTMSRSIDSVLVSKGGSGYVAPTATAFGGGGTGCVLGTPTVVGGAITAIPVTSGGSGYTSSPDIVITDSAGTGAAAAARALYNPPDPGWLSPGAGWVVGEMIFSTPHNLKAGQNLIYQSGNTKLLISNGFTGGAHGTLGGGFSSTAWPTGPNSVAFNFSDPLATTAVGMPGGTDNVAGTFATNYQFLVSNPPLGSLPYECAGAIASTFTGCDCYVPVPVAASDNCMAEIARRIRDNTVPGRKVYVELGDENWNGAFSNIYSVTGGLARLGAIGAYVPDSTTGYVTRASQVHNVFVNIFNQSDVHGNANRGGEIVRVIGSQAGSPNLTNIIKNFVNAFNSGNPAVPLPVDVMVIASYCDTTSRTQPNPGTRSTVNPSGGGLTGGSLGSGLYYVSYTWVDSLSGNESTIGSTRSAQFSVISPNIPQMTLAFPSPNWTSGARVYLTPVGGAPGTEVLYATGVTTTTFNLSAAQSGSISPPAFSQLPSHTRAIRSTISDKSGTQAYLTPTPWSHKAALDEVRHVLKYSPLLNSFFGFGNSHQTFASQINGVSTQPPGYHPYLVTYEGGIEFIEQSGEATDAFPVVIDLSFDPEFYNVEQTHLQLIQQGGIVQSHVFKFSDGLFLNALWPIVNWHGQAAGRGDGSPTTTTGSEQPKGTAITNQFWDNTGATTLIGNANVRLQALRDWMDALSPTAATPLHGMLTNRPVPPLTAWRMRS
jgi:hypothetical protein